MRPRVCHTSRCSTPTSTFTTCNRTAIKASITSSTTRSIKFENRLSDKTVLNGFSEVIWVEANTPNFNNGGNYFATLPSVTANYRLRSNMSIYGQFAQGRIVPPSAVFHYKQPTSGAFLGVGTLPKQQMKNTTYQTGTTLIHKRVTFDAGYFHIHCDNSYSSTPDPTTGEPIFYAQPPSNLIS